jgi:hypothetical protein
MSSDETAQESAFVVSRSGNGGRNHVHTDPECPHVQRAKNVFEKPRSVVDDDRLCRWCSGEFSPASNSTTDTNANRKLLSSTSPEELGLSAIGERDGPGGDQA